jgi:hypothetical protein
LPNSTLSGVVGLPTVSGALSGSASHCGTTTDGNAIIAQLKVNMINLFMFFIPY